LPLFRVRFQSVLSCLLVNPWFESFSSVQNRQLSVFAQW
jgi:hypothetical protein